MIATATWIGSLPTWIILIFGVMVAWRVSKGGGSGAVSELSKANEVLEKRAQELGAEVRDLRVENERLKARTDFATALAPIMEWTASHELRAQERHTGHLAILELIAQRLGPDENGAPDRRSGEERRR